MALLPAYHFLLLDRDTREREIFALTNAMNDLRIRDGTITTVDEKELIVPAILVTS